MSNARAATLARVEEIERNVRDSHGREHGIHWYTGEDGDWLLSQLRAALDEEAGEAAPGQINAAIQAGEFALQRLWDKGHGPDDARGMSEIVVRAALPYLSPAPASGREAGQ